MEKMPFQPGMERGARKASADPSVVSSDWRSALPVLAGSNFSLRELRVEDAASLFAMLTTEEVARFISPPPTTVEGFEKFIQWAQQERAEGNYACYAVVPHGVDAAIGIFQVRTLEPGFAMAEWGFALGSQFWGTNLFAEGAWLILGFTFETIGVRRLEARAAIGNARGNGALRKVGAVQEGVLRRSFFRHGIHHDQMLWSILAEDWTDRLSREGPARH